MDKKLEALVKATAKKFADKKAPKNPETQWRKGAEWMYDLLMNCETADLYRQQLHDDVKSREGEVPTWKVSLINELADLMAERDAMQAEIRITGRLIEKQDKNMIPYKEANPLLRHVKEKEQSISVWRDKLGLSNTVNPERIRQDAKKGVDEKDPMARMMAEAQSALE
jgi:hypothetical protein